MTLAQRIATWLDPTPARLQRGLFELTIKAARRCAHDLEHCAADVWYASRRPEVGVEQSRKWHEHAQHWQAIFYPDNGMKNYHASIVNKLEAAEATIDKLREHCKKHGITPWLDDDIPF
jgi:hypothetical protein